MASDTNLEPSGAVFISMNVILIDWDLILIEWDLILV